MAKMGAGCATAVKGRTVQGREERPPPSHAGWWDTWWQSQAKRQTHLEIANHGQLRRIRQKHFSATLANDAED